LTGTSAFSTDRVLESGGPLSCNTFPPSLEQQLEQQEKMKEEAKGGSTVTRMMTFMNKSIGTNSFPTHSIPAGHSNTPSGPVDAISAGERNSMFPPSLDQIQGEGEEKPLALPTRKTCSQHQTNSNSFLSSILQATNSIHTKIAATTGLGIGGLKHGVNPRNGMHSSRPQVQSARLFTRQDDDGIAALQTGRHSCNIWKGNSHTLTVQQQQRNALLNQRIFRSALSQGNLHSFSNMNMNNLTTRLTPIHTIVHSTAPPVKKLTCTSNERYKQELSPNKSNHYDEVKEDHFPFNVLGTKSPELNLDLIQRQLQRDQHLSQIMLGRSSVPVGREDFYRKGLLNSRNNPPPPPPSRPPPQLVHPIPLPHHHMINMNHHQMGGYKSIGIKRRPGRNRSISNLNSKALPPDMFYDFPSRVVLSGGRLANAVHRPGHITPHVGLPCNPSNSSFNEDEDGEENKSQHFYYEATNSIPRSVNKSEREEGNNYGEQSMIGNTLSLSLTTYNDSKKQEMKVIKTRREMSNSSSANDDDSSGILSVPANKRSRKPIHVLQQTNISPPPSNAINNINTNHYQQYLKKNNHGHQRSRDTTSTTLKGNHNHYHHESSDDGDIDSSMDDHCHPDKDKMMT